MCSDKLWNVGKLITIFDKCNKVQYESFIYERFK